MDSILKEAKRESRHPRGQNGLYFGFLEEEVIESLNENRQWKDRTNGIETIEAKMNTILQTEKKLEFLPYATPFLGFMINYIQDINFKISMTSIKIITKLLSLNLVNVKKYFVQLCQALMEKLSDSKQVVRTAIFKCSGQLIQCYKASQFAMQINRYLSNSNWHVKDGVIHLLAHCLLVQLSD